MDKVIEEIKRFRKKQERFLESILIWLVIAPILSLVVIFMVAQFIAIAKEIFR